ncbi:MAG: hypothetical protein J3Q66DRAFT_395782 [Benniella sp.]|nr:MAG: hypothetical protein J3Q66DRAFT_395782 [Benniella sp.]
MSAINASIRSIRAPLQAIARRQYSSATSSVTNAAVVGHSNQRLAIVAGVSFADGVIATYVYYNYNERNHTHFTMSKPVSVFDIPLLLDMICGMLDPKDIRNCTSCSKKWYSFFGPYRFESMEIRRSDAARNTFLLNNSHHIRGLTIDLSYFDTFIDLNCERLRNLTLGFGYEENEESDHDDDLPDDMELDKAVINKPACAAKLIQGSPSLRIVHLSSHRRDQRHARPVAKSILKAISNHRHLTKIRTTLGMTCCMLGNLLNHLPQQLQELDVSDYSESVRNHSRCDRQSELLKSRTSALDLRRLAVSHDEDCFFERMFIHLLRRCPKLEELMLPIEDGSFGKDALDEVVEVLESNCKCLHTLNHTGYLNTREISVFLKGFSKGFREISLGEVGGYGGEDPEWNRRMLETLLTTASVNTIEVLKYTTNNDRGEDFIGILKHCTQIRVFRVEQDREDRDDAVDLSDLLLSMDKSWKCWDTLEDLELMIVNKKAIREHSNAKARRRRTARDARELCLRFRSFPKLTTLDIDWQLRTTWGRRTEMSLSLEDLNKDAVKNGSATMTKEDAKWAGLRLA